MKVSVSDLPISQTKADVVVVPIFEGEKKLPEYVENKINQIGFKINEDFKGKLYETFLLSVTPRILLVGLGQKEDFNNRVALTACGTSIRRLLKSKSKIVALDASLFENLQPVIEGALLAEFDIGIYKTSKDKNQIEELIIVGKGSSKEIREASIIADSINWVRRLIQEPANQLVPKKLVDEAKKISREYNLGIEIFDEKQSAKAGMGAFVGIAQGSHEPSFMVVLKYQYAKSAPTLGVVGKGITFDSGGLSIKPSEKMHEMKMDMAGAAAAIGFMKVVGQLKPKINIVCVTPLTENLPGGGALKPGDVVKALNGKTIEVLNTDAEGRVVLADGLTIAQKRGATKIVDLATLTGAVIVALGSEATAILGNNDDFTQSVIDSGNESGERMWKLPLYPEHKELLKSDIADLANIPPSRGAGVIAGAVFLQEFIEPKNDWVHLDIAGTAWLDGEKSYSAKGPSGVGIRTLLNLTRKLEKLD